MRIKLKKLSSRVFIYFGFLNSIFLVNNSTELLSKENIYFSKNEIEIINQRKTSIANQYKTNNPNLLMKDQTIKISKKRKEKELKKNINGNYKIIEIGRKGYVNAEGPLITINFKNVDAKDALMSIAKLGNYGFIYVPSFEDEKESSDESKNSERLVSLSFVNEKYEKVLNSILMASGYQGKR